MRNFQLIAYKLAQCIGILQWSFSFWFSNKSIKNLKVDPALNARIPQNFPNCLLCKRFLFSFFFHHQISLSRTECCVQQKNMFVSWCISLGATEGELLNVYWLQPIVWLDWRCEYEGKEYNKTMQWNVVH